MVLLGFSPEQHTDVLGHVAGFLAGAVMGVGAAWLPAAWLRNPWLGRLGQALAAGLVLAAWGLALGRGRPL